VGIVPRAGAAGVGSQLGFALGAGAQPASAGALAGAGLVAGRGGVADDGHQVLGCGSVGSATPVAYGEEIAPAGRMIMVLADGKSFSLDINEFSAIR